MRTHEIVKYVISILEWRSFQNTSEIQQFGLSIGVNLRAQNSYIGKALICREEPVGLSFDNKNNLRPFGYSESLHDYQFEYLAISSPCNCSWIEKKIGERPEGAYVLQSRSDDFYIARSSREAYYVGKVHINCDTLTYRRNHVTEVHTSHFEVLTCNCSRSQIKWKIYKPRRVILNEAIFSGYDYQKVFVGKAQNCYEEPVEILVTNSTFHTFNFPKGSRRFDFSNEEYEFFVGDDSCNYEWILANRQNIEEFHTFLRQNSPRLETTEPDSLYFGRTYFNNTYHFGKYSITKRNFYFTVMGNEKQSREFEILACDVSFEDVEKIHKNNENLKRKIRKLSEEVKIMKRNARNVCNAN